jgi:hypothetical protein
MGQKKELNLVSSKNPKQDVTILKSIKAFYPNPSTGLPKSEWKVFLL